MYIIIFFWKPLVALLVVVIIIKTKIKEASIRSYTYNYFDPQEC